MLSRTFCVWWATEKKDLETEKEDLNIQLLQARKEVEELTATINEKDEKLLQYEDYIVDLRNVDTDDFSSKMQSLWEKFKKFTEYFLVDISPELFELAQWDPFIDALKLQRDAPPLPLRNTDAAKKARMAATLGTSASQLAPHIFTPFYKPTANDDIRELLLRLAYEDCKKEKLCRSRLLSQWTKEDWREAEEGLPKETTDTVAKRLVFGLVAIDWMRFAEN